MPINHDQALNLAAMAEHATNPYILTDGIREAYKGGDTDLLTVLVNRLTQIIPADASAAIAAWERLSARTNNH